VAQIWLGSRDRYSTQGDIGLGAKSHSWRKLVLSAIGALREGADDSGVADVDETVLKCRGALALPDVDHIWRQAKDIEDHYSWHRNDDGNWVARLRSAGTAKLSDIGMRFDPDLSVQWKEHLELHGETASRLIESRYGYPLVFEANVGEVRLLRGESGKRFYVAYTPTDEDPYGCSHSSVLMLSRGSKADAEIRSLREDLSLAFKCQYGTPTVPIPEGA